MKQVLMVMGEMDIGLITATIPPTNQVSGVEYWVALFILYMFMTVFTMTREVDIGLIPATLLPITVEGNEFPHQGTLKIISLGVG